MLEEPSTAAMPVINPATGEVIDRVHGDSKEDIVGKVSRARGAQPEWAAVPLARRERAMRAFAALLLAEKERLARTLTSEMGKPLAQARAEITSTAHRIDFFLAHTAEMLADEVVLDDPAQGVEERITQEPLGVIANISAWNYPYFVGSNVFVPALLTGNTVLYKPSEHASLTGLAIVEALHTAGVPDDVVIPVIGAGEAGAALLAQPVDGAFFTGSFATGLRVARTAAERLLPIQLELGGKDPVYVCEDAPLTESVSSVAEGAFYNSGQSCCAVERVYVHRRLFPTFVEAFVEHVRGLRVGDPMEESAYVGPLARQGQLAVLKAQVDDAVLQGARVRCGGSRVDRPGFFFEPTVLVDVNHSMAVMREESFGPVIGVQAVADDEEAVDKMNDTAYGLTAAVYTPDTTRARRILSRMKTGSVYWNCCDRVSPRLPWSGRGQSGLGVTLSRQGIRAFLRPKAWHLIRIEGKSG